MLLTDRQTDRQTDRRLNWIDWAKGWTILFVVIFHTLSSVHNAHVFSDEYQIVGESLIFIVSTFIMPVFLALSGYVYKPVTDFTEYKSKTLKRIISLAIPYVIFSVAYVMMQHVSPGSANHAVQPWSSLLWIFAYPISYLWYIYTLVLIYMLSGFLDLCRLSVELQLIVSFFLFIIASYMKLPFFMVLLFTWTVAFCFGRMLRKYRKIYGKQIGLVAGVIMLVSWVLQIHLGGPSWYDCNALTPVNFVSKMASIPVFFSIYSNIKSNRINRYFEKYGRDSLIIYLVHAPTVSVMRALFVKLDISNYFLMIVGVVFMAWTVSILACFLAKKFKPIEFIFYPTRYIIIPK